MRFLLIILPFLLFANPSQDVKNKRIYPMGERIFSQNCPNLALEIYSDSSKLKEDIDKGACGNLKEREKEALFYYIHDIKIVKDSAKKESAKITVPPRSKCPVCGMFVDKYPRWAAMAVSETAKEYYFDGVKDMAKFILNRSLYDKDTSALKSLFVTDYYTQSKLNAREAVYVIKSDVYGPMGHELIPFQTRSDAEGFIRDHGGEIIDSFDKIDTQTIKMLE